MTVVHVAMLAVLVALASCRKSASASRDDLSMHRIAGSCVVLYVGNDGRAALVVIPCPTAEVCQ